MKHVHWISVQVGLVYTSVAPHKGPVTELPRALLLRDGRSDCLHESAKLSVA